MDDRDQLFDEIDGYYRSYEEMLGSVPAIVSARFKFSAELDPEFLRAFEALRARIVHNPTFDAKTTQLMLFTGLLASGKHFAARYHAIGARREGATWQELHTVVELASLVDGLSAMNNGIEMLSSIASQEVKAAP